MRFALPFRASVWWPHIAPPAFAIAFFAMGASSVASASEALWRLSDFTASLLGTAAFGYFLNDCADIEPDRRAGKRNTAAGFSPFPRLLLLFALLFSGAAPWWWLAPVAPLAFGLWVLLVVCLAAYSVPPLRLKTRPLPGVFCDMAYGHLLPALVALALFAPLGDTWNKDGALALFFLIIWLVLKGLRNILLHQFQDRAADKRFGERTFVVKYGAAATSLLLNRLLIPLEILSLMALGVALIPWTTSLLWGLVAFLAVQWLSIGLWWGQHTRWNRLYNKFWFVPNDFYEGWLPLLMGYFWLDRLQWPLWWLLVVFAVFPFGAARLWRDLRSADRNISDTRNYWLVRFGWMWRKE